MSGISFAAVPGAGTSAPVEKVPEANASVVPPAGTDTRVAAPTPTAPTPYYRFDDGEDDQAPVDRGDVKLPRLNIIQGLSGPELKKVGPDGTLALKQSIALPQPARIVVVGCSKARYAEKPVVYGEGDDPRIFDTLEEVINAGGTDQWRQSRENKDKEGIPLSRKPWFAKMVTSLLMIQLPTKEQFATVCAAGKPGTPTDEQYANYSEHFSVVSEDGIAFAPCVYTVKSTSFGGFYVPLKTEQVSGVLKGGYSTKYVLLKTKQVRAFEPVVEIVEPTSEAVRKLAKSVNS